MDGIFWFIGAIILIFIVALKFVADRYKRCPSNKVIVVYGKTGENKTARCVHGGGVFVMPLIQDYALMSLEPMTIEVDLKSALSKKNIRVNVPSTFTVAISTNPSVMQNAAERLLGMQRADIINQANDIILGQLRLVIATLTIEEINGDRETFSEQINVNVNAELKKIGLEVINVNIRDITDESGYIDAIGKKAAAEAINQANIDVAQQDKLGQVGVAEANREKEVQVAQQTAQTEIGKATAFKEKEVQVAQQVAQTEIGKADAGKEQRIKTAALEATAVEGENKSKAEIADYNATLAVKQADALKMGEVAKANAQRDIMMAQKEQEEARLKKEELARQEVNKLKIQVEADAEAERLKRIALGEAEKIRNIAKGEADAIKVKYLAEAEGVQAVLEAKAQGYKNLINVCNARPEIATSFLMIEKVDELVAKQVEAIKNIKFDKITVWDGGAGSEKGSTTANFLKDLIKSLPAMHDLANQAGVELPQILGSVAGAEEIKKTSNANANAVTKPPVTKPNVEKSKE
ncbi:flotillin family protein [bacterium]|nr:flotillin family protein [bacterium]